MPNNQQAVRRVVKSDLANQRNRHDRSKMRTTIKSLLSAVANNDSELAKSIFKTTQKLLDTLAKKRVIPQNRASRYKQRLNARIKSIA
jgi:small subunit ribosomal protein S20